VASYDGGMVEPTAQINLPGAVVLVTGGSRGIGAGIARAFLGAAADVIVCGRKAPMDAPESDGRRAQFISCDVRDSQSIAQMFARVASERGRLDVLINNAGGGPPGELANTSARVVERIIQLNLMGPLLCAQAAHQLMQAQPQGGCIINIGSVAGLRGSPSTVAYGAAKAGLLQATQSLAMEWGPKIRVNAIVAGYVATDDAQDHYGGPAGIARIGAEFPLGRFAKPADIASACLYLASPLASYVSGAQLAVHGGGERPLFLHLLKGT
jgi:NAD(P)-dependent dehydrogenase (short-subunit alcohol dehydrogenase family)